MSNPRKLSVVNWLPEFNMADVKPEAPSHRIGSVVRLGATVTCTFSTTLEYEWLCQHCTTLKSTLPDGSRQPEIKMATCKPEIHYISGMDWDIREIPVATPTSLTAPDSLVILPTLADVGRQQEIKMVTCSQKYAISLDWIEILEKFRWLHRHFLPRPIHMKCCHRRPTSANSVLPVTDCHFDLQLSTDVGQCW